MQNEFQYKQMDIMQTVLLKTDGHNAVCAPLQTDVR